MSLHPAQHTEAIGIENIVDLDAYPLDRLDSARGRDLIEACRSDLASDGMFDLEGLVRPRALAEAVASLKPVIETASFGHRRLHNVYFVKTVEGLPQNHPALRESESAHRTICADQFPDNMVRRLYEWPSLIAFIRRVLGQPSLYTMADPLARANVMAYGAGQGLGWHFDRSPFTTTILLQAPDQGGVFEYRTALRSDDDPNYDGVARLLAGQDDRVRKMSLSPGTFNLFMGKNTAHRVTPVSGGRDRIMAVFSYYRQPDVMFSEAERIGFYGRAA